jgi:hypothetical protein
LKGYLYHIQLKNDNDLALDSRLKPQCFEKPNIDELTLRNANNFLFQKILLGNCSPDYKRGSNALA